MKDGNKDLRDSEGNLVKEVLKASATSMGLIGRELLSCAHRILAPGTAAVYMGRKTTKEQGHESALSDSFSAGDYIFAGTLDMARLGCYATVAYLWLK